jgi:predicted RNase H-like HicB family nuclease
MKYIYPATFTEERNGVINVNFPDFDACFTYGSGLADALDMAEDVLTLTLCEMEQNNTATPVPTDIRTLQPLNGGFLTLVKCDTSSYQKYIKNVFI